MSESPTPVRLADNFETWFKSRDLRNCKFNTFKPSTSNKHQPKRSATTEDRSQSHKRNTVGAKSKSDKCTLRVLPPEVRNQIFALVLEDYFREDSIVRQTLVFQDDLDPFGDDITEAFPPGNRDRVQDRFQHLLYFGTQFCHDPIRSFVLPGLPPPPALESALIPERPLYREIFSSRIKACIIELRPCIAWDWNHEFPSLSSDWAPTLDCLKIVEPEEEEWPMAMTMMGMMGLDEFINERGYGLFMAVEQLLPSQSHWSYQYPSLASMPPLMLASMRTIEIRLTRRFIKESVLFPEDYNNGNKPVFDIYSCKLEYAKNLTKLSLNLSGCPWENYSAWGDIKLESIQPALENFISAVQLKTLQLRARTRRNWLTPSLTDHEKYLSRAMQIIPHHRIVKERYGLYSDYDIEDNCFTWNTGEEGALVWYDTNWELNIGGHNIFSLS